MNVLVSTGIPQVHVPHDLTRLTNMLREREKEEPTNNTTSSSSGGVSSSNVLNNSRSGSIPSHSQPLHPLQVASTNTLKSSNSLKRKKEHHHYPQSSNHPPRRSLRKQYIKKFFSVHDINNINNTSNK